MDADCKEKIYSEDYVDYLVEQVGKDSKIPEWYGTDCYQIACNRYAVVYLQRSRVQYENWSGVFVTPRVFGLLSSDDTLEEIGVAQVQRMTNLNLTGQGVMIGFVDTGIDYTHPAFINADGTTRIWTIWDQTVQELPDDGVGRVPEGFLFGAEYNTDEINIALSSDDPWSVVPSRDENGHGTFLAGVACGNRNDSRGFAGVAPLASICVVKCKEAKQNLKEYFQVQGEEPCYAESDVMMGIRYLWNQAVKRNMQLVVCLGMGTNLGGHNTGGCLGEMMAFYGGYRGTFMVSAGGNEANASHHYYSDVIAAGASTDVELKIGPGRGGFTMELWSDAPDRYSIGLISPSGEYSGKTIARLGERNTIRFLFEQTTVEIEYLLVSAESGDECIRLRFMEPQEGIWNLRVFNENNRDGKFHVWLPMRNFISEETYFLQADPNVTICDPANSFAVITTGFYNGPTGGIAIESSRGYNRVGLIKPDFVSPGIQIYGPLPEIGIPVANLTERAELARYGYQDGSSAAAALTAGTVALLVEWGLVRRNDISMDTITVQKYLIQGANPAGSVTPNREWGNGQLDLFGVFDVLRPK